MLLIPVLLVGNHASSDNHFSVPLRTEYLLSVCFCVTADDGADPHVNFQFRSELFLSVSALGSGITIYHCIFIALLQICVNSTFLQKERESETLCMAKSRTVCA